MFFRTPSPRGARALLFVAILGLAGPLLNARAETKLRWKFQPGETRHYAMVQKTASTAQVQGQKIETQQDVNIDMTWAIKEVASDGSATLVQTMDRIRFAMDSPLGQLAYDTQEDKPLEGAFAAMGPIFKAMVNEPVELQMTDRGEIKDVKVPPKMIEAIQGAGPAAMAAGQMFSEDGIKKMMGQSMMAFEEKAVTAGDKWEQKMEVAAGAIGTMVTTRTFTYSGPEDGSEAIDVNLLLELKPAENQQVELTLKEQDSKGKILFDNTAGYLKSSEMSQKFRMSISVMGQTFDQDVTTEVSMKEQPAATTAAP